MGEEESENSKEIESKYPPEGGTVTFSKVIVKLPPLNSNSCPELA